MFNQMTIMFKKNIFFRCSELVRCLTRLPLVVKNCFILTIFLSASSTAVSDINSNEPIKPIPLTMKLDQGKVELGNRLFHDKRLSHDDSISCASCHSLRQGGVDRTQFSSGIKNQLGGINSPTVYNSVFNFRQFWDGRAADLAEQAAGPVHNPVEMGSNWNEVINKLSKDSRYMKAFGALYKDGLKPASIQDAIAVFEASLITPNSKFDRYLRGQKNVLSKDEAKGYKLFKSYGCVSCHQGVNVGGNMYQKFGVLNEYFKKRGNIKKDDYGLYNVTGDELDKHVFKVPSLRMVALTPPYFHDGSVKTLEGAVDIMFEHQLGRSASADEKQLIVKFLHTLAGDVSAIKEIQ